MSKTAHTPAPWRIGSVNTVGVFGSNYLIHSCTTANPNSISIAEVYKPNDNFKNREVDDDIAQANARLIAAAPDLLNALKDVLRAHDYDGALTRGNASLSPAIRDMVERTIAKAEGKS